MEFQYYGNFDRPPRRLYDQPWWDEEDNLTDRRINGKAWPPVDLLNGFYLIYECMEWKGYPEQVKLLYRYVNCMQLYSLKFLNKYFSRS